MSQQIKVRPLDKDGLQWKEVNLLGERSENLTGTLDGSTGFEATKEWQQIEDSLRTFSLVEEQEDEVSKLAEKEALNFAPTEKLIGLEKYFNPINRMRDLERVGFEIGFISGYKAALKSSHGGSKVDWDLLLPEYRDFAAHHLSDGTIAIQLFTWIKSQIGSVLEPTRAFTAKDMIEFAGFNYRQQNKQPQFTTKDNFRFYLEPKEKEYDTTKEYSAEIVSEGKIKLIQE